MIRVQKGFSLVEILVSLIIISLVATAFVPVLSKKLSKSKTSLNHSISKHCVAFSADCKLCYKNEKCLLCDKSCSNGQYLDILSCSCKPCSDVVAGCNSCSSKLCSECKSGYGLNSSKTSCVKCTSGTYSTGNAACKNCEKGTYNLHDEASSCTICEAGYYCAGGSSKIACPAGYYSISGAKQDSDCIKCPAGSYNLSQASTSCLTCPAGFFCTGGNHKEACPAGKFQNLQGQNSCSDCEAGSFSSSGASVCKSCSAGSISDAGAASCNKCSQGTYSLNGQKCEICPEGTFSQNNASSCTPCPLGSYSEPGAFKCTSCAEDFGSGCSICTKDGCTLCKEGIVKDDGKCVSCKEFDENCKSCTKDGCIECVDEYYLVDGKCAKPEFCQNKMGILTNGICIARFNAGDPGGLPIPSSVTIYSAKDAALPTSEGYHTGKYCWKGTTAYSCDSYGGDYSGCKRTVCTWTAAKAICEANGWRLPLESELRKFIVKNKELGILGLQLCDRYAGHGITQCESGQRCPNSGDGYCAPRNIWGRESTYNLSADAAHPVFRYGSGDWGRFGNVSQFAYSVRCIK